MKPHRKQAKIEARNRRKFEVWARNMPNQTALDLTLIQIPDMEKRRILFDHLRQFIRHFSPIMTTETLDFPVKAV